MHYAHTVKVNAVHVKYWDEMIATMLQMNDETMTDIGKWLSEW